ncbi:hypothetical protein GXP67_33510 [Rhodocytophaga rosea]|uniref:Uncharacterized protein n=1 Tax=Rhodocytophaga rosea TaxID=2704465 RepID=A0A6C0GV58_9BACT|nr:hypothetical protein [Rhodocytophaga rosea]QHT71222.1 hypothetical protein GXP67_33510 [Rhodocytophaga rosea]
MSDRITAIIPKDATSNVNVDTLELARKTVVKYLIKKVYYADGQVDAYLYKDTKLFYQSPEDIFSEFNYDWMYMHCNQCQKDVKAWWYKTVKQLPDYNNITLPCPCGKTEIDLNRLEYGGINLYFVRSPFAFGI